MRQSLTNIEEANRSSQRAHKAGRVAKEGPKSRVKDEPSAYVTVGLPGSGKSTIAKHMVSKGKTDQHELDKSRQALGKGPAYFGADIVKHTFDGAKKSAEQGRNTVLSNTSIPKQHRQDAIDKLRDSGYDNVKAVLSPGSTKAAMRRNRKRTGSKPGEGAVPQFVMNRMAQGMKQLKRSDRRELRANYKQLHKTERFTKPAMKRSGAIREQITFLQFIAEAKVDNSLRADQKEMIRNRRLSPEKRLPVRGESPRDTEDRLTQQRRTKTARDRGDRIVRGSQPLKYKNHAEYGGITFQKDFYPEKVAARRSELRAKRTKNNIRNFREDTTFSEFLELAEKYYSSGEKLRSGRTPLEKAEKRAETEYKNTKDGKERQNRQKIQLNDRVRHGVDNPHFNTHQDMSGEVRVSGYGDENLSVRHLGTDVQFDAVNTGKKTKSGKPIYDIMWNRFRNSQNLSDSERRKILRTAEHVWKRHFVHRLPYGAVIRNEPISNKGKQARKKLYSRIGGFGDVNPRTGYQYASVGREPSPKQKAKDKNKIRTSPMSSDTELSSEY